MFVVYAYEYEVIQVTRLYICSRNNESQGVVVHRPPKKYKLTHKKGRTGFRAAVLGARKTKKGETPRTGQCVSERSV